MDTEQINNSIRKVYDIIDNSEYDIKTDRFDDIHLSDFNDNSTEISENEISESYTVTTEPKIINVVNPSSDFYNNLITEKDNSSTTNTKIKTYKLNFL